MTATLERIDKFARLLIDGRLLVTWVDGILVTAECRGDSGDVYKLGWDGARWYCGCEARGDCSHLRALWMVTVRPRD